jgi:hypothetical protein
MHETKIISSDWFPFKEITCTRGIVPVLNSSMFLSDVFNLKKILSTILTFI